MTARKLLALPLLCSAAVAAPVWAQTSAPDPAHARSPAQARAPEALALAQSALFEKQASELIGKRQAEGSAKAIAQDMGEFASRLQAAVEGAQLQTSGEGFGQIALSDQQRQELDQLGNVSTDQLGTRYVQAMIGALQQQQQRLRAMMTGDAQPSFRNMAQQNLPEVERRLANLQNAQTERPDRGAAR